MTDPELVAAIYLEVAAKHQAAIENARGVVTHRLATRADRALVEIDEAMRAVIADDQ